MALDEAQKKFIRKKVRKLGNRKAVKEHYNKDDLVSKYARRYAKKRFPKLKKKEKK